MQMVGFDNKKYLFEQSGKIKERIASFGGKLYLEFGGKLFDDYHASRVLPGFEPDSKIKMLMGLKDEAEIIVAINADHIEQNKIRGDFGIPYGDDTLRLVDAFRDCGLYVGSIVITHFHGQQRAVKFKEKLESLKIPVYLHYVIPDYPSNIPLILSEEGFGKNDYIKTSRSLVVVTAPGPGSGKMATCLSQIWHENKRGIKAGYAKYETFPVWNLPLKHPVNLAYEAATVDLDDVNMIDPFHLEAYNKTTVNYNRDVEIFPVLNAMLEGIWGKSPYNSPTDMGVNMVGFCISDDRVCSIAAKKEIVRRYYSVLCEHLLDNNKDNPELFKMEMIMKRGDVSPEDRPVIAAANKRAEETGNPAVAIEMPDGTIVTGKTTDLLGAAAACLLNALKHMAGVGKEVRMISSDVIHPIQHLKVDHMGNHNPRLHTDETLIALTICAVTDSTAGKCIDALGSLHGCDAHSSVILSKVDENLFKKLGINISFEPAYQVKKLYHK